MKTDELIDLLARDAGPVQTGVGAQRFALALGMGGGGAALLMLATLGVNPALAQYVWLPTFWIKVVFVAVLASISLIGVQRLSRPGAELGQVPTALASPILAVWAVAILVLLRAAPEQRAEAFFGQTWAVCPLLVALLSGPVFVGLIWAMRSLAPTRLRLAGAAAGFLAGAVGALVYCLHCPELSPPFIGFWYLLGILIPTGIGALLGNRLLRW